MDFDAARPEATPRRAQGNAADIATNERREILEYDMAEILLQHGNAEVCDWFDLSGAKNQAARGRQ
jgi:hypothetical protein